MRIRIFSRIAVLLLKVYKKAISPMLPPSCRFYPTCSEYAMGAYTKHGFIKGSVLSVKRVCKCHPWNPGGYDPVPEHVIWRNNG